MYAQATVFLLMQVQTRDENIKNIGWGEWTFIPVDCRVWKEFFSTTIYVLLIKKNPKKLQNEAVFWAPDHCWGWQDDYLFSSDDAAVGLFSIHHPSQKTTVSDGGPGFGIPSADGDKLAEFERGR